MTPNKPKPYAVVSLTRNCSTCKHMTWPINYCKPTDRIISRLTETRGRNWREAR